MFIKHKPWHVQVFNAWCGPILDPATGQTTYDEELDIFKTTYKTQFYEFKIIADIVSLEMFNTDADRLQRIKE